MAQNGTSTRLPQQAHSQVQPLPADPSPMLHQFPGEPLPALSLGLNPPCPQTGLNLPSLPSSHPLPLPPLRSETLGFPPLPLPPPSLFPPFSQTQPPPSYPPRNAGLLNPLAPWLVLRRNQGCASGLCPGLGRDLGAGEAVSFLRAGPYSVRLVHIPPQPRVLESWGLFKVVPGGARVCG